MARVLVIDAQGLMLDLLKATLASDPEIELLGGASGLAELAALGPGASPDVVLADLRGARPSVPELLSGVKAAWPGARVLALADDPGSPEALAAMGVGVDGLILKDGSPALLLMALKCVAAGLHVIHHEVHERFRALLESRHDIHPSLTAACEDGRAVLLDGIDRTIIRLISEGKCNKEIGEEIHFAEGSVKNRISRILASAGLKDRTHIVMYAVRHGLI